MPTRDAGGKARAALAWLRPRLPRAAVRVLTAASVFVLAYVAYSHAASIATRHEYELGAYDADLGSERDLARFSVTATGGLTKDVEGGVLRVHGKAAELATLEMMGPEQRLDDVVRTSLRFRPRVVGPYDVYVGLVRADGDGRHVVARARLGDADPPYLLEGDPSATGARHETERWGAVSPPAIGLGTDGGADAGAGAGGWHEVALEIASYTNVLVALADRKPFASSEERWPMGTRVRLFFGVAARSPGATIDVDLARVSYETRHRLSELAPFTDHFSGKIVDTRTWTVVLPDGLTAETDMHLEPSRGLVVATTAKVPVEFTQGLVLLSAPGPLASFDVKMKLDVARLENAGVVVSVIGAGITPARFTDVGIRGDAEGKITGLAVGDWNGTGQTGARTDADAWKDHDGVLEMKYDASSGDIHGWVNGRRLLRASFDLLPGDTVELRVSVNLHAKGARADVAIREVSFDR